LIKKRKPAFTFQPVYQGYILLIKKALLRRDC